jgi:hypothetical protein
MNGYRFYAELPAHYRSKSGCRSHGGFTRDNIKTLADTGQCHAFPGQCGLSVCAVIVGAGWRGTGDDMMTDAVAAVYPIGNSPCALTTVSAGYLAKRAVRIDEATARKLHPALFGYLAECEAAANTANAA